MKNAEVAKIMGQMQEEIVRLYESCFGAPNTKEEQEKMKEVDYNFLSKHPIGSIKCIYVEVDFNS